MVAIKTVPFVDSVKWLATIIQLFGYGMTGLNMVPYNIYLFFIGIFLWFAVGYVEGQGHHGGPCGGVHLPFCGLSERLIRQMDLLNSAKAWRASLDSLSTFLLAFLSLSRLMRKPLISS